VDVTVAGGDFQIKVELRREPTQDEVDRMTGVIQAAHAEFRHRIAEPGHAG
jgi:hypothetical protein